MDKRKLCETQRNYLIETINANIGAMRIIFYAFNLFYLLACDNVEIIHQAITIIFVLALTCSYASCFIANYCFEKSCNNLWEMIKSDSYDSDYFNKCSLLSLPVKFLNKATVILQAISICTIIVAFILM